MPAQKHLAALTFAIGLLAFTQAHAQEDLLPCDEAEKSAIEEATPDEIKRISSYTPAVIKERKEPRYPVSAAKRAQEGWVLMSYVIDEEGNVQEPVVEDFTGAASFKYSALRAVEQWKYDPALKNGKPTQQCHHQVRFDFTMGGETGASRRFVTRYKNAIEFIENGDFDEADNIIQTLHRSDKLNRYENAWLWNADAKLAAKLQDNVRELTSLQRTISSSRSHSAEAAAFNANSIAYMRQRIFALQTTAGLYGDALDTIETIKMNESADAVLAPLQETIENIHALLISDQNIFVDASINDDELHFHTLARSQFAFVDIEGRLDTVEVRCEAHRESFTIAEEFIWSIPESWGQCRVLVKGQSGTRFSLVEVAST